MRQGQNNAKRSRGRGRKPQQHSTNRAYDSNGPDVKVRGTAATVCEKYQQLARDAISAGDRVTAENYYQHAEHYYRLLMAAQAGQEGQQRQQSSLGYRPDEDEESENDSDNENDFNADGPQPRHPGQPWHQQGGSGGQPRHNNNSHNNGDGQSYNRRDQSERSDQGEDETVEQAGGQAEDVQSGGQPQNGPSGEQGEGQPRRRQNRRRRPRSDAAPGGERGEGPRPEPAPVVDSAD